jgi:hypothetical protein
MKLFGIISVGSNRSTTDQIVCTLYILEGKWKYSGTVHQLFVDSKEGYGQLGGTYILYNNHIKFGIPMKLVRLIKICLNRTYSEARLSKHLPDNFLVQNGLKQGNALSPLVINFSLKCDN